MKTLLSALALLALAATPLSAQTASIAAATLPDTVQDAPASAGPAMPAAPTAADAERIDRNEAALRAQIAGAQAGTMAYDAMSDTLAAAVREQEAAVLPLFQQLGALQTVIHSGVENGADLFTVTFENAVTQWVIAMNPEGKIAALLFRPAPDAS